jgi:hypothetical protein
MLRNDITGMRGWRNEDEAPSSFLSMNPSSALLSSNGQVRYEPSRIDLSARYRLESPRFCRAVATMEMVLAISLRTSESLPCQCENLRDRCFALPQSNNICYLPAWYMTQISAMQEHVQFIER